MARFSRGVKAGVFRYSRMPVDFPRQPVRTRLTLRSSRGGHLAILRFGRPGSHSREFRLLMPRPAPRLQTQASCPRDRTETSPSLAPEIQISSLTRMATSLPRVREGYRCTTFRLAGPATLGFRLARNPGQAPGP